MKNKWKILCGILTMSTMLVSAGCTNPISNTLKEADEAYAEFKEATTVSTQTETSDENADDFTILLGGETIESGETEKTVSGEIASEELTILDELPDILRNSDLPRMDHYSEDTDVAINYYNPTIPGYISIVCYENGETEISYDTDNNGMGFKFYKSAGAYFDYSVRGITKDNVNAPVFGGYDIPLNGRDFGEFSKDIYNNAGAYSNYYSDFDFTEDLSVYQNNLNTILARFGVLSDEAFDVLGLSWDDFGINFGEEYKKYDALATLAGTDEKVPMLMEKQTFTNGINDATGQTWVATVRDGIKKQAFYNSREGEAPTDWFAYNEANSNNFVDGSDYVQIETYDEDDQFFVFYHYGEITDGAFSSKDLYINFYDDEENTVKIKYLYENDFRSTDTPGVIASDTRMGFTVYCKASEMKDIFASEESLKAALTEFPNVLYDESEYMTNDEMIEDFMWRYKRYMASIDDNIKTMGTCMADYGIEY